jgi:anti-sigma factor ChrR (cupin superfamily)
MGISGSEDEAGSIQGESVRNERGPSAIHREMIRTHVRRGRQFPDHLGSERITVLPTT